MMISVITINYNNKEGLIKTIKSVIGQTYSNFEYIIIDGNSIDGSKEVLESYKDQITSSLSEPDHGIYNAMNKGIRASNGDYLLFLNSGDTLISIDILSEVSGKLNSNFDIYYGDLIFKTNNNEWVEKYPHEMNLSFLYERSLPHPASFIRRNLFETVFYFNENLTMASDWEFFMCAILKNNASYKHLGLTISYFDLVGISNSESYKDKMKLERIQVMNNHFPLLMPVMEKLDFYIKKNDTNRYKMLEELEKSKISQKLNSLWLRILLNLFRNKNLKDL